MKLKTQRIILASILVSMSCWAGMWNAPISAQDSVTYQPRKNEQPIIRKGTIIEYDARFLTLKLEKIERKIPTEQIKRIQTKWLPAHLQGDQQKSQHHFLAAIKLYEQAFELEPRLWVRRQILASMVECFREAGQFAQAAIKFDELIQEKETTRFFHQMPVVWSTLPPNAGTSKLARDWMQGDKEHLALVGASIQLSAADRAKALSRLQRLTQSKDQKIAQYATMLIWRSRALTASSTEVKSWSAKIEKIPEAFRAGGYFVIGTSLAQQQQDQKAATTLLRVPILYPEQHQLAASALHRVAKLIKKSDPEGAERIDRELAEKYPETPAGQEAQSRLRQPRRQGQGKE